MTPHPDPAPTGEHVHNVAVVIRDDEDLATLLRGRGWLVVSPTTIELLREASEQQDWARFVQLLDPDPRA